MSAEQPHRWLPPALSLLMVGWGANQFASLLAFYRQEHGFSELAVTSMLGIYVAGLLPALLFGGRVSDVAGRRPVTLLAVGLSVLASVAMTFGALHAAPLFAGRLVAGVATGMAMAATTSWVKELSQAPWDPGAGPGVGARRASLATTAGFWLGPVASGLLANWAPAPDVLPYLVHVALCLPLLWIVARLPETRGAGSRAVPRSVRAVAGAPAADAVAERDAATAEQDTRRAVERDPTAAERDTRRAAIQSGEAAPASEPQAGVRRFRAVVVPAAPWVFGSGTIGFAVVPSLMEGLGDARLLYSTAAVGLTLGAGVLVQPVARRVDSVHSARAVLVALGIVVAGLAAAIVSGLVQNPWAGLGASALLGAGYGLMLVSGLLETQRIAPAARLGAFTGRFYTLAYLGFLAPTVHAFLAQWFDPLALVGTALVLAVVSAGTVAVNSRRHLPTAATAEPAGARR